MRKFNVIIDENDVKIPLVSNNVKNLALVDANVLALMAQGLDIASLFRVVDNLMERLREVRSSEENGMQAYLQILEDELEFHTTLLNIKELYDNSLPVYDEPTELVD